MLETGEMETQAEQVPACQGQGRRKSRTQCFHAETEKGDACPGHILSL